MSTVSIVVNSSEDVQFFAHRNERSNDDPPMLEMRTKTGSVFMFLTSATRDELRRMLDEADALECAPEREAA